MAKILILTDGRPYDNIRLQALAQVLSADRDLTIEFDDFMTAIISEEKSRLFTEKYEAVVISQNSLVSQLATTDLFAKRLFEKKEGKIIDVHKDSYKVR